VQGVFPHRAHAEATVAMRMLAMKGLGCFLLLGRGGGYSQEMSGTTDLGRGRWQHGPKKFAPPKPFQLFQNTFWVCVEGVVYLGW